MFSSKRSFAISMVLAFAASFSAMAQTFPTKPVRLVVTYPPGGLVEVVTRAVAEGLSRRWGQPVLIETKPGGSAVIGTQFVVRSEPDGHVLLIGDRVLTINPFTHDKLPYDATRDLVPVANMVTAPMVIAVPPRSPYKSMPDLLKAAAATPNKLTYGSFGKGTMSHIDTELVLKRAGVTAVHIPYKGMADVTNALMGDQIDFGLIAFGTAIQQFKAGKINVLAYLADKRHPEMPNVPSAAELRLPESSSWMGVLAPAGTPSAVVEKISRDLQLVLTDPAFIEKHAKPLGMEVLHLGPQEFARYLAQDRKTTAAIVQTVDVMKE